MGSLLTEPQKRWLTRVLEQGAKEASSALSRWLGRDVRLDVSDVEEVELEDLTSQLGPADALVASCSMDLTGNLTGRLLMVFEDQVGMTLTDLLLRRPVGTSTEWGELERSAALETANIVGCAYLNSLASHLALGDSTQREGALVPSPPSFRQEFAASLLEFALMDQAVEADRLLLISSRYTLDDGGLRWRFLFVPSGEALRILSTSLTPPKSQ